VDVTHSQPKVFKTPHTEQLDRDEDLAAVDVAMAACARRLTSPPCASATRCNADGGCSPRARPGALHEASILRRAAERVTMLSVGTATESYQPDNSADEDDGAIGWLSEGADPDADLGAAAARRGDDETPRDRYLHLDARGPRRGARHRRATPRRDRAGALGKATVAEAELHAAGAVM